MKTVKLTKKEIALLEQWRKEENYYESQEYLMECRAEAIREEISELKSEIQDIEDDGEWQRRAVGRLNKEIWSTWNISDLYEEFIEDDFKLDLESVDYVTTEELWISIKKIRDKANAMLGKGKQINYDWGRIPKGSEVDIYSDHIEISDKQGSSSVEIYDADEFIVAYVEDIKTAPEWVKSEARIQSLRDAISELKHEYSGIVK